MKPKTRLLEIQLQMFGNPEPIVVAKRHFVYNRICQMKVSGIGKKYKYIHLYIFNDGLLWCSKRGQFKRSFSFKNTNLLYGVPKKSNSSDASMFIKYGSKIAISTANPPHAHHGTVQALRRKRIGKRKEMKPKSRTFSLSATVHTTTTDAVGTLKGLMPNVEPKVDQNGNGMNCNHKLNGNGAMEPLANGLEIPNGPNAANTNSNGDVGGTGSPSGSTSTVPPMPSPRPPEISIEINHGKPCKKTILVFVNEKVRDQCLEKIKVTQTKYLKRCQRELQIKRLSGNVVVCENASVGLVGSVGL